MMIEVVVGDSHGSASKEPISTEASGCDFCLRLNGLMPERPWFDFAEVDSSASFVTVVALGALTPGHILVVSRRHVERIADLNVDELIELEDVLIRWRFELAKRWIKPRLVFEHGGRSSTLLAGCVAHSHVQVLPLDVNPVSSLNGFAQISSIAELRSFRQLDYMMVWDQRGIFVSKLQRPQAGQFFRRRISEMLGRADSWDYLAFPNLEVMKLTLDQLARG